MKDTILWSTDFDDNYKDESEFIAEYGDLIMHHCNYRSKDEITSDDVLDEFEGMNDIHYGEVRDMLIQHDKEVRDNGEFLVKAKCGRWDGVFDGGRVIGSMLSVLNEVIDFNLYQYGVKIEVKDNCLVITGTHHDNSDEFTVYQLTPKGQKWFEYQGYGADTDREVHEHLLSTKGYLRKPFYGKLGLDKWEG